MEKREFLNALLAADTIEQIEQALTSFVHGNEQSVAFVPIGRRPNNRGAIEVATDPGRSLIERVTNAHDALLELEHDIHNGTPICKSPREAAAAWLSLSSRSFP